MTDFPNYPLVLIYMAAYLDPGSGSILIQMILAGVLGLGVLLRLQWNRIKALFGKKDLDDEGLDAEE